MDKQYIYKINIYMNEYIKHEHTLIIYMLMLMS